MPGSIGRNRPWRLGFVVHFQQHGVALAPQPDRAGAVRQIIGVGPGDVVDAVNRLDIGGGPRDDQVAPAFRTVPAGKVKETSPERA